MMADLYASMMMTDPTTAVCCYPHCVALWVARACTTQIYSAYMYSLFRIYWEIESIEVLSILSIRWCTRLIDGYEIVRINAPYSMAKLLELREGDITSTMISMDIFQIHYILWEQDNKVLILSNCMSG